MGVDQENREAVPGVGLNPWTWDESSGERNDRRTARGTSDDPELVPDYSSLQGWGGSGRVDNHRSMDHH